MSYKLFRTYLILLFVKFLFTWFLYGTCFWGSISFLCKISRLINILSLDLCLFKSRLLLLLLLLLWRFADFYGPFSRERLYRQTFWTILLTIDMWRIILDIFNEFRRWSVNWVAPVFVWYCLLRLYLMFTISLQNLHLRGLIISHLPVVIHEVFNYVCIFQECFCNLCLLLILLINICIYKALVVLLVSAGSTCLSLCHTAINSTSWKTNELVSCLSCRLSKHPRCKFVVSLFIDVEESKDCSCSIVCDLIYNDLCLLSTSNWFIFTHCYLFDTILIWLYWCRVFSLYK